MDYEQFCCPNQTCPDFDKHKQGNITLYTRYGRKQIRLLMCTTCGKTFSELKGTPFWDSRLDWDTIEKIYKSLLEGQGIRATARTHGLSKNTVKRYLRLANKDLPTITKFLQDRKVIGQDQTGLNDLLDRYSKISFLSGPRTRELQTA